MATPRWYMVDKMGMATLCKNKKDAGKEARAMDMAWPHMGPHRAVQLVEVASVAANAGSEPVAEVMFADGKKYIQYTMPKELLPVGTKLYTHPSPPEGMVGGWIALPGTLPEPGTPVLLDIGKKYPIRAMWAAKNTAEAGDDDWGEYDKATDTYYCPEGWYEWNEHEETHWAVDKTPRAWAPLPPIPLVAERGSES